MSRFVWLIAGVIVGVVVVLPMAAYVFVVSGGMAMATTAKPLPLEETFAKTALRASIGNAKDLKDPLPQVESNMVAGARIYVENCAVCHGVPAKPATNIAKGEFPKPPQLFDSKEMVTDDPEGVTFWKISHGIRLTGMPGFGDTLAENERWQVTMLMAHADKLTPAVQSALAR